MKTTNFFEGAKFGDKFVTRKGEIVLFIEENRLGNVTLICKPSNCVYSERTVKNTGRFSNNIESEDDVVGRYEETSK